MESGGRILLYVKNRSRETLFCTGHWLKLRFTKQFLASIRNLHFIPTSRHSERIHKIYILPSNFFSSKREDSFFFFFTKATYPEKMGNILLRRNFPPSVLPFLFSRKRPLLFILVFFHPPLIFPSPFLFQFLLFLPPARCPNQGPRW